MKKNLRIDYTNFTVGLAGTLVGMILYFLVIPRTIELGRALRLGHHLFQMPDFTAKMWTLVIIVMSVIILVGSFMSRPQTNGEDETKASKGETAVTLKEEALSVGILFIILVLYIVLLPLLSFIATSILCLFATLWWFGYRHLLKIGLLSVTITVILYFVFTMFLYVSLP